MAPLFTAPEAGEEVARDRLARSADLSGEALELMPEEGAEEEPAREEAVPAGASAA